MSKIKLLSMAVIGLLFINAGIVGYLYLNKTPASIDRLPNEKKEGPKKMIIDRLHFDKVQVAEYELLITHHRKLVKPLKDSISDIKNSLYQSLTTNDYVSKDSLIHILSVLHKRIEAVHYDHFIQIKNLCKPNQMQAFEALTTDLAFYFSTEKKHPRHTTLINEVYFFIKFICIEMKHLLFFIFCCTATLGYTQSNIASIKFNVVYGALPMQLGKKFAYLQDSIEITTLKFYISNIRFYQQHELVYEVEKKYHLVDIENPLSVSIEYPYQAFKKFNRIHFNIGVDSIANVSGAMDEALDPLKGMYWAWQSGYINFKIEGKSNICPARKNQFTFHIGGYQYPNNTLQNIELPINQQKNMVINIDMAQLFIQSKLNELYEVMSPNEKAVEMAKKNFYSFLHR